MRSTVDDTTPPAPRSGRLIRRDVARTSTRLPSWSRWAAIGALLVVGALFPFYMSDYADFQMARVFALALAVMALNLLTGFTGQISVGHGALMGLGAYTTLVLIVEADVPYLAAVGGGTVLCFFSGLLIGLPALRIRGLYLALVTLGAALVFPPLVRRFPELTGGVEGLLYTPPPPPFDLPLTSAQWLYLVAFVALVVCTLAVRNLVRGRIGRALSAVREDEIMAASNGVPIGRLKTLVFGVSAGLAGLAGGIYQLILGTATPETYAFTLSITLLTASVLGGIRTLLGAVVGAAFIVYVPDFTADLGDSGPQLIYAVFLLAALYFFPKGVVGSAPRLLDLAHRARARRRVSPQP